MFKDYVDIVLPYESADNYYIGRQKGSIENFIWLEPEWYSKLFNPTTFYILGSKGSGKTLLAAYMCAERRNGTVSKSYTIDVGDYGKLIAMKQANHLDFTDYLTMWKVILIQKFLFGIDENEISFWNRNRSFEELQETISSYFGYDVTDDSFNPVTLIDSFGKQGEVTNYLHAQVSGGIDKKPIQVSSVLEDSTEEKEQHSSDRKKESVSVVYTDTWMRSISEFKKTIDNITFKYNHFLFVDGLDVRPNGIDAKEYSECIGALVRAVYDLNTRVFGSLKRKDNHDFKIVALTRTDIFLNSELVNVTSCINDNCIELDWSYSNEREFQYSTLYRMMNRILGWDGKSEQRPVEQYFSFFVSSFSRWSIKASMFIQRQSRLRPRDIVVMLQLIQKECKNRGQRNPSAAVLGSKSFVSNYSSYYAEQIKSEMMFKYTTDEIKKIFELIKSIREDTFKEVYFEAIYNEYVQHNVEFVDIFPDYHSVLDSLYSLDIIGWREIYKRKSKVHWHYREVKAIDEVYRLPWEQIRKAEKVSFIIHRGASKHILGTIK